MRGWDPDPEVAAQEQRSRRLRDPARRSDRFFDRRARLDFEHARVLDAAGEREQDGAGRAAAAHRAIPGVTVPSDQGDVRKGLDVLHERRDGSDPTFAGIRRSGRRRGDARID